MPGRYIAKRETKLISFIEQWIKETTPFKCPYGTVGDRLWVRETWATISHYNHLKPSDIPKGDVRWPKVWYDAGSALGIRNSDHEFFGRTRPSIFMPRWASRTNLLIKEVRVERIQEITYTDVCREGVEPLLTLVNDPRWLVERAHEMTIERFTELWDNINLKRGYGWAFNPWVWMLVYEVENGS